MEMGDRDYYFYREIGIIIFLIEPLINIHRQYPPVQNTAVDDVGKYLT